MPSYKYDANGKLISVTKTNEDKTREQEAGLGLVIVGLVLLPFYPIFLVARSIYYSLGAVMHPLFAGIGAAIPALGFIAILLKSKFARLVYFGFDSLWATRLAYDYIYDKMTEQDTVWAIFGSLIVLCICGYLTKLAYEWNIDD